MSSSDPSAPSTATPASRRPLAALVAVAATAFVVWVAVSGARDATPAALAPAGGGMGAMRMDGAQLGTTLRDVDRRTFALPGGRAGALVVFTNGSCGGCLRAVKRLAGVAGGPSRPLLVAAGLEADVGPKLIERIRSAGPSSMRTVVDSRGGTLAMLLGSAPPGSTLVFDRSGAVVARLGADAAAGELPRALRAAGRA